MWTAFSLIAAAWAVILSLSLLIWSQMGTVVYPTTTNRMAALFFLVMALLWAVIELGWLGGQKDKASHM